MLNIDDNNKHGFTLVELLVVLGILSVMSGALYMVINPSQLQRKAREAALKSSMTKVCAALFACASVKSDPRKCTGYDGIGVVQPTEPPGANFVAPYINDSNRYLVETYGEYDSSGQICRYSCSYDFSTGATKNLYKSGSCID